jgi:glycosyltransferase involved in cell wall biosynthesis
MARLPEARLYIVGRGPEEGALQALARRLGVHDRVRLVGAVDNAELRWWYSAADASLLCSSREGWANVLLESMACGTPVVATDIWGTPEVMAAPDAGVLMGDRTAGGLVAAWQTLQARAPRRAATRRFAEAFSWEATSRGQLGLFRGVVAAQAQSARLAA